MLQCRLKNQGDQLQIQIAGDMDEEANFPEITSISNAKSISLDLEELGRINSAGIRLWMSWIRELESLSTHPAIILEKCPVLFVYQLNLLSNFVPKGSTIRSFFVSLFRESDESEKELLFTPTKQKYSSYDEITRDIYSQSEAFKNGYELDLYPETYFKFLVK